MRSKWKFLSVALLVCAVALSGCGNDSKNPGATPTSPLGGTTGVIGACNAIAGTPIDPTAPVTTANFQPNSATLSIVTTDAYYPGQFSHAIQGQGSFNFYELVPLAYQMNVLPQTTSLCVSSTTAGQLQDYNFQTKGVSLVLQGWVLGTRNITPVAYPLIYPSPYPTPTPTTPTVEQVNMLVTLTFNNTFIDRTRPGKLLGSAMVQTTIQATASQPAQNLPVRNYWMQ